MASVSAVRPKHLLFLTMKQCRSGSGLSRCFFGGLLFTFPATEDNVALSLSVCLSLSHARERASHGCSLPYRLSVVRGDWANRERTIAPVCLHHTWGFVQVRPGSGSLQMFLPRPRTREVQSLSLSLSLSLCMSLKRVRAQVLSSTRLSALC